MSVFVGMRLDSSRRRRWPTEAEAAAQEGLTFEHAVKARFAELEQELRQNVFDIAAAALADAFRQESARGPAANDSRRGVGGRPPPASRRRPRTAVIVAQPSGPLPLSPDEVLEQLRQLAARGIRRTREIGYSAPGLMGAAISHFGSLARARRRARLPAVPLGRAATWNRERLVVELRQLYAEGCRLTVTELRARGRYDLLNAIAKIAGSMSNGRRLAGVPEPVIVRAAEERWDADRVVAEIRERYAEGEPIASSKVPPTLLAAAMRYCSSWKDAIEQAGFDYDQIRLVRAPHTKEELVAELRELAAARPDATPAQIHALPLAQAIKHAFGSLRAGLKASGLADWPRITRPPLPAKEGTLELIRARHEAGAAITPGAVNAEDNRLYRAARRHFGSWDRAIDAAGLPMQRHWLVWTKERVIERLRARHASGQAMTATALRESDPPLYYGGRTLFGNIAEAVRAAGVPVTTAQSQPAP